MSPEDINAPNSETMEERLLQALTLLQQYAQETLVERGYEHEPLQDHLLYLAEETGELIAACRPLANMRSARPASKDHASEEAADVLNALLAAVVRARIDLATAFIQRERYNAKRRYRQ